MKNRSKAVISAAAALMMLGAGCSINNNSGAQSSAADSAAQSSLNTEAPAADVSETESEQSSGKSESASDNKADITLDGSTAAISEGAQGVTVSGSVVTVSAAGDYTFTGTLDDGQIIVNAPKTDKVDIYLNNVTVNCSASAPIRIEQADGVTIHLMEGTVNTFTDSAANNVSACISSKDDLTIKGKGTLNVTGAAKHAIKSSNDIRIKNGVLNLSAASAAVYGEDSVQLTGGTITVTSCKDGIKASNKVEADKGFVTSEEATVDIQNASGNGIEAVTGVTVKSGSIKIHSLKQAVNCKVQSLADGCVTKY